MAHLITAGQAAVAINCYAERRGWSDRISMEDMRAAGGDAAPVYEAITQNYTWLVGRDDDTGSAVVAECCWLDKDEYYAPGEDDLRYNALTEEALNRWNYNR